MMLFKTFIAVVMAVSFVPFANACLSSDEFQVIEGNDAVFKIKSNCSSNYAFLYKAVTVSGEAQSPGDFTAYSGEVRFTKDDRTKRVSVETIQDNVCEIFEKFKLKLSNLKVRVWRNGVPVYITPNDNFYRSTTFKRSYEFKGEIAQTYWKDSNGNYQCT